MNFAFICYLIPFYFVLGLSELLHQFNLSNEDPKLKNVCDDDLFIQVSQHVDDYTTLSSSLNLPTPPQETIPQSKSKGMNALLWDWKRKNGDAATPLELVKAILKMGDHIAAKKILEYLSKKPKSEKHRNACQFAPEKVKNNYENWEVLTESEKERVRNRLMDQNSKVREAYTDFIIQLSRSFKERMVDPKEVEMVAHSFGHLEGVQQLPVVFNFAEDSNVTSVFSEISKHCTWFNYESFLVIVKKIGNDDEKQYLSAYENEYLIPYLQHSIFEIPCASCYDQSERTVLKLKVSADLHTNGNEIKAIQRNVAKLLGFDESTLLHFESYNEGCIELIFSLPTVILKESSPTSQLCTYIEWEQSRNSYKLNVDLTIIL